MYAPSIIRAWDAETGEEFVNDNVTALNLVLLTEGGAEVADKRKLRAHVPRIREDYSYAKNYVKSFGVYPFTDKERELLLSLSDRSAINDFVASKYRVMI